MTDYDIKQLFYSLVAPSQPNEWEIEDVVDMLSSLELKFRNALLKHVPAIWPISHSLCYSYLQHGSQQLHLIPPSLHAEWVRQILFHYETTGLRAAESFMANAQTEFINKRTQSHCVTFADINKSMVHYLHGISAEDLTLAQSSTHWTDTKTIFLPSAIEQFNDYEKNRLFYKFLITYQWALIHMGCFKLFTRQSNLANKIKSSFTAKELYKAYCFNKACNYMKEELPGLWKRSLPLIRELLKVADKPADNDLHQFISHFITSHLTREHHSVARQKFSITQKEVDSFLNTNSYLTHTETVSSPLSLLLGTVNLTQAVETILLEREKRKSNFTAMLITALVNSEEAQSSSVETSSSKSDDAKTIIKQLTEAIQTDTHLKTTIQVDNAQVIIPQELLQQTRDIINDLGSIPIGYVQAATGTAGRSLLKDSTQQAPTSIESKSTSNFTYDEWDCRRQGYRKDWCTLVVEDLPLIQSNFIEKTLTKHSGLRKRLQKQFEAMLTSHQFIKRQRDGDELDLDAITEAIGAKAAGKPTGDRFFARLQRNSRNISTLFLVDMSNSTSGWINTFIKEALVLLCEAMEKLGDQYGIYGFSGMRRSRCKLYPVKKLETVYNDEVQNRLASITPKDYTRMAPAIRHLTKLLERNDSSTRLIIVLSDGKPEDYDGYNGEYAIEDTKKALLEARGLGITPFCITIDKEAHSYLSHMFGQKNYTFINKIDKLPTRIPQIYQNLTR